jgi:hypothetical protein
MVLNKKKKGERRVVYPRLFFADALPCAEANSYNATAFLSSRSTPLPCAYMYLNR